jgi:hypothetical protein
MTIIVFMGILYLKRNKNIFSKKGHVLLVERLAATIWPKAYGKLNRPYLAIAAFVGAVNFISFL